jgi:hypothetical protein
MEIPVRPSSPGAPRVTHPSHQCPQCRTEALIMRNRHVSAAGWGEPVVTEYYECDFCEAHYSYSPATHRWKRLAQ